MPTGYYCDDCEHHFTEEEVINTFTYDQQRNLVCFSICKCGSMRTEF